MQETQKIVQEAVQKVLKVEQIQIQDQDRDQTNKFARILSPRVGAEVQVSILKQPSNRKGQLQDQDHERTTLKVVGTI